MSSGNIVAVSASRLLPTPNAPWSTVTNRFDKTLALADQMLELLIGTGNGGYLGVLNSLINESAPVTEIVADDIDNTLTIEKVKTPPVFNSSNLGDFPEFNAPDPAIIPIPLVDISTLSPPESPADINPSINWTEIALSNDIYSQLLTRISTDIIDGATGLSAEVQDALFLAGTNRQRLENDKAYQRVQNDIASRGSSLPSGALLGAITEISTEILNQNSEINRTIVTTTADLAQKNSQFIIEQARLLETLLRDTRDKESNRSLDYEKTLATLTLQIYTEKVKMYIAIAEANKMYIEAQVANLQGVAAYNMALLEEYKAHVEVYGARIDTAAKKNTSLVDVFKAEIAGYDSETKAISQVDLLKIEKIKTDIMEAEMKLKALIADTSNTLSGYTTETALKERVSNDMASIATQSLVGALSSVNANASVGYRGSESKAEQWSHGDTLREAHTYPHDPES